jgi:ligand-binding SRPBCC domain-containing protein
MFNYTLYRKQLLPITLDQAWEYFSSPHNLQEITPKEMAFTVLSKHKTEKMYPGQIICYYVKPVLNIPLFWMTEITHVKDKEYFVDEQRYGPYSFWHHQHFFSAVEGGVLMEDLLHYKLPLGPLGALANSLFVSKKLDTIFNYRKQVLEVKFGKA